MCWQYTHMAHIFHMSLISDLNPFWECTCAHLGTCRRCYRQELKVVCKCSQEHSVSCQQSQQNTSYTNLLTNQWEELCSCDVQDIDRVRRYHKMGTHNCIQFCSGQLTHSAYSECICFFHCHSIRQLHFHGTFHNFHEYIYLNSLDHFKLSLVYIRSRLNTNIRTNLYLPNQLCLVSLKYFYIHRNNGMHPYISQLGMVNTESDNHQIQFLAHICNRFLAYSLQLLRCIHMYHLLMDFRMHLNNIYKVNLEYYQLRFYNQLF